MIKEDGDQDDRQEEAVEDLGDEQGLDHVDAVEERAEGDQPGEEAEEGGGLAEGARDAFLQRERLGDGVGGRQRQDRPGEHQGPVEADAEDCGGILPGQRSEGAGGVGGRGRDSSPNRNAPTPFSPLT